MSKIQIRGHELTICVLIILVGQHCYFILLDHASLMFLTVYKLVRFYEPGSREQYATTRVSLTIFTVVAFLLLFATFAVGLKTFADFDRGLAGSKLNEKNPRPKYSHQVTGGTMSHNSYNAGTTLGPRISIE
ncbi:hypothetical protein E1B28_008796 [Marasmius oreades]|uniref:Uncharacterized protein n=1 Tax=Marasmius oreades TaxID=181124 RepID=A0A9P7RZ45_9AGAR|nr:uncharacterized protein E1B28_008796 [Marasmius oreades]KAG7092441.1 hypothetical protein E1B28_008796 [Marasmius oreades]